MNPTIYPEYSKLAQVYDEVMHDVDYELWADFIDELMVRHHPNPVDVLELACGTGSIALSLDELACYNVTGTDKSPQMIERGRRKNDAQDASVTFQTMDFLDVTLSQTFDVVFSAFDSINYLKSPEQIITFLQQTQKLLRPESLLIYDFTTPQNSVESIDYLNDEEDVTQNNYRFHRFSSYDEGSKIHTNKFKIDQLAEDGEVLEHYEEVHQQRAYTHREMLGLIDQTDYKVVAKYGEFDFRQANDNSLRITMVLRCPGIPS